MKNTDYIGKNFCYDGKMFVVSALNGEYYTCMELRKTNEVNLYIDDLAKKPLVDGPDTFIRLHVKELAVFLDIYYSNI